MARRWGKSISWFNSGWASNLREPIRRSCPQPRLCRGCVHSQGSDVFLFGAGDGSSSRLVLIERSEAGRLLVDDPAQCPIDSRWCKGQVTTLRCRGMAVRFTSVRDSGRPDLGVTASCVSRGRRGYRQSRRQPPASPDPDAGDEYPQIGALLLCASAKRSDASAGSDRRSAADTFSICDGARADRGRCHAVARAARRNQSLAGRSPRRSILLDVVHGRPRAAASRETVSRVAQSAVYLGIWRRRVICWHATDLSSKFGSRVYQSVTLTVPARSRGHERIAMCISVCVAV